jgi:16S rRNA (guanine527-N7)-methyltransferase
VAGAAALGVDLAPATAGALISLLDRIELEPQNLTSITGITEGVERHLLDSLAGLVVPAVRSAGAILDLGSGAGFPGIPLAMARPEVAVTLVESERSKAGWLARASVSCPNVCVVAERSEDLARRARERWPVVTARAVAPLPVTLELAAPLVAVGGEVVVWRARPEAAEEAAAATAAAELGLVPEPPVTVNPVPGAPRALHRFRKTSPAPARFPRRPGRAAKRPLAVAG